MIDVHHYGIHHAGGVGYLIQRGGEQSLYPGVDSPFVARGLGLCPHHVDLSVADPTHHQLLKDPLIGWFANPKGVVVSYDTSPEFIEQLAQLYCPTEPLLALGWGNRMWRRHMGATNLCPWVLVEASVADMDPIMAARYGQGRPLLCLGKDRIPARQLETTVTELPSPEALRALGAWAIKKRLLNEDPSNHSERADHRPRRGRTSVAAESP